MVRYEPREANPDADRKDQEPTLVLGDGSELDSHSEPRCIAAGVPIGCDARDHSLTLHTSIVGLPPVYLYRDEGLVAVCSDIHLIPEMAGARLRLSPRGVSELATIGHPVEHRTLFAGLSLVPSGGRLRLGADGSVDFSETWSLPPHSPRSWAEFIEAQGHAFTNAVRRLDLSSSFLSLTAGLDTRTVFATLAKQKRLIPTVTMTGSRLSLDARTAGRLSAAYGIEHHLVVFDDDFVGRLPELMQTASRLSGGLASLDQAPEVYLYEQLGGAYSARLSGNLGNQVGRGGTEGVSTRDASLSILSGPLRDAGRPDLATGHWLLKELGGDQHATIEHILRQEILLTLVANFPIGNFFATQQTPYADRALIETLALRPQAGAAAPSSSMLRMRLRDLAHRFRGEPEAHSFQRTLVKRIGGFVARYPINWGWRAAGGVSPVGTLMGVATLIGMYSRARGLDDGRLGGLLALTGLPALHDFRESRRWLREHLRDFARDTLTSRSSAELFDRDALEGMLDAHFSGAVNHYQTITFALDLALAHKTFCATS